MEHGRNIHRDFTAFLRLQGFLALPPADTVGPGGGILGQRQGIASGAPEPLKSPKYVQIHVIIIILYYDHR